MASDPANDFTGQAPRCHCEPLSALDGVYFDGARQSPRLLEFTLNENGCLLARTSVAPSLTQPSSITRRGRSETSPYAGFDFTLNEYRVYLLSDGGGNFHACHKHPLPALPQKSVQFGFHLACFRIFRGGKTRCHCEPLSAWFGVHFGGAACTPQG